MAQVTFVKGKMARLLYESGFRSVRSLSEADAQEDIVPIMMSANSWKVKALRHDAERTGFLNLGWRVLL